MKKIYQLGLATSILFAACNKYESLPFEVEKPEKVANQEVIDAYGDLTSYINKQAHPNFLFGAALSLDEYANKGVMYRLANRNFQEIVMGWEMKHGGVVQADGRLALDNLTRLLQASKAANMKVFGHTLMWHANQNANYLKGLLTPLVITSPAFPNDLNKAGLEDGSFSNWTKVQAGAGITIENNQGMGGSSKAIRLVSSAGSNAAGSLQLQSPSIPVVAGHKYEVVCYIKSDIPGEGRFSFEGLGNNTPALDWTKSGSASATFSTGISWKEIRFQINDFSGSSFKLNLDLGYKPGVTYYVDVDNFYVYDTQGTPIVTNLVANGDFETGAAWGGWGNNSTRGITPDGQGVGNRGKAFFVNNPSRTANFWTVQTIYEFPKALNNGETYNISFWVKGTAEGTIRPELQSPDFSSNGFGQVAVTRDWKQVNISTTVTAATRNRLIFSYGEFAGTVYIDDVVVSSSRAVGGKTTIVEKTALEKELIIRGAMTKWISEMVTHCKDGVTSWDVVNEPMDDGRPYELKTAVGRSNIAPDEFFWQDYLGKDYAVEAFKLARQYGNPNDIHFINDYNLEFSLDKCRGLIEYVRYIESKGARVDGIGTQMHISINADTSRIKQSLQLLAATGKLIKISELDIGVGVRTTEATAEHYQKQADMYRFVIEQYFEIIPAAQRYGITLWSPRDSPANSSWRAGEPIGIWTEGLVRKQAYAAVAEALKAKAK